jgi:hypothetical protein
VAREVGNDPVDELDLNRIERILAQEICKACLRHSGVESDYAANEFAKTAGLLLHLVDKSRISPRQAGK